jgi:hypothetical protein
MHTPPCLRLATATLALVSALAATACSRTDPVAALEPIEVETGWYDAGILEDGKNKLVPSVSLRLRNTSERELTSVQINAIFKRVGEDEVWGEHWGWAVTRDGLEPGGSTGPIVLRSLLGYTGEQARSQMLQNREFVDAKVELYLKRGSQSWTRFAEFPIQRQLLTR